MKELLDTCGPDGAAAAVQERLGNIAENADKPLKHPGSLAENARDLAQEPLSAVREHGTARAKSRNRREKNSSAKLWRTAWTVCRGICRADFSAKRADAEAVQRARP